MTQGEFGRMLGVSQASVSSYESGKTIPIEVAKKLLAESGVLSLKLSLDQIYERAPLPALVGA